MQCVIMEGLRTFLWLLMLLLLLGVERAWTVKWLALHRVRPKSWTHNKNCSRKTGLVKQQVRHCRSNLDLMPSVVRAATMAVDTCQNQFSDRRWNCSSVLLLPGRPKDLSRGTREKAYVYSISAAAIMHSVAHACSVGITTKCSCGVLPSEPPDGVFKWGGCGDNLHFGAYFCRRFIEASRRSPKRKKKKKKKSRTSTKALMDSHNFAVGRIVTRQSVVTACKCHGVSGSCSIKTCWKGLPDFDVIGAALKKRYALAVEVKRRKRKEKYTLIPIQQGKHSFEDDELVYYVKSPDYCYPDEKTGSVGTRGRLCDPTVGSSGHCGPMCCGRGADNITVEVVERCECKYYWCCYVKCKTCVRVLNLSKCR